MSFRAKPILWLIPVAVMILTLLFVNQTADRAVNADDASELVLARQLKEENSILAKDWYYSTELRLLNTNLVYAFFFRLTDNWHTVRILSYAIMYSLLLLAAFLYGRKAKGAGLTDPLPVCLLVIPTSDLYYQVVLKGGFYLPHLTIAMGILAMEEWYLNEGKARNRGLILSFSVALALLSGMGGPRQVLTLFAPMLVSAGWICFRNKKEESRKGLMFSAAVFLAGVIGYGINVLILAKIYAFKAWTLSFAFPTAGRVDALVKGFLAVFGYRSGPVTAGNILANGMCVLWIGLSVLAATRALREKDEVPESYVRIAALTCAALILFILLYLFTDMLFTDQYFLPVTMLTVPLLMLFFRSVLWKRMTVWITALVLTGVALAGAAIFAVREDRTDANASRREITRFLVENDYRQGYATFWNANILTELSNGEIEVWIWADNGGAEQGKDWPEQVENVDDTFPWLQRRSHEERHPEGKVFLLMTNAEYDSCPWIEYDTDEQIVCENGPYRVLGYNSYGEMKDSLFGY